MLEKSFGLLYYLNQTKNQKDEKRYVYLHITRVNKGTLLPILTTQKMNSYLKEIADVTDINPDYITFLPEYSNRQ